MEGQKGILIFSTVFLFLPYTAICKISSSSSSINYTRTEKTNETRFTQEHGSFSTFSSGTSENQGEFLTTQVMGDNVSQASSTKFNLKNTPTTEPMENDEMSDTSTEASVLMGNSSRNANQSSDQYSHSKESVLSRIPGNCKVSPLEFDCGNDVCIPIKQWRDCNPDCPNGIDEECWEGQIKCDGCKCVDPGDEDTKCRKH